MKISLASLIALLVALAAPSASQQVANPPAASVASAAPRRVCTIPNDAYYWGPVSADGRLMPYSSADNGDIYVYDLKTGAARRVTNTASPGGMNGEPAEHYGEANAVVSPDGTQVAYSWRIGQDESLRVVSLQGSGTQPPRVLEAEPDVQQMTPTAWSPDGKWIAFTVWWHSRSGMKAGLVSALDKSVRVLKSTDREGDNLGNMFFSPSGQYLAYEHTSNGWNDRHVTIVATDTFKELVADLKIDGNLAGWTRDGVAYVHRTAGSAALFVLPLDGIKPGEPRRLTPDLGDVEGMGISAAGAFYYQPNSAQQLWRSTIRHIDFARGRVSGMPAVVTPPKPGTNIFAASWSRDGKRLALIEGPQPPRVLYIRSNDTGALRVVPAQLAAFQGADLSPDGKTIATIGMDKNRKRGLFLVDAETGAPTLAGADAAFFRTWSGDGSKVYFDRPIDDVTGDVMLVEHDVTSAAEREIYRASGRSAARMERTISSDGKTLYYLTPQLATGQPQSLVARDVASGRETTLVRDRVFGPLTLSSGGQFIVASIDSVPSLVPTAGGVARPIPLASGLVPAILAWAPDDRSFIGRTIVGSDRKTWQVSMWWVPVDGRAARKLDLPFGAAVSAIGSSGNTVAFVDRVGNPSQPSELWMVNTALSSRTSTGARR